MKWVIVVKCDTTAVLIKLMEMCETAALQLNDIGNQ